MLKTEVIELNMGPQHPSMHGVLRVLVTLQGERVLAIKPDIGYLHRGIEKMAESRTYAQFTPLTDRLDYTCSMLNNWAYVAAVEKLAGIEVPERAEFIRVIAGELNRVAAHLLAIFATGADVGALTVFFYTFREREMILKLIEELCGARLTYNFMTIGGVTRDLPDGWADEVMEFCDYAKTKIDDYERLLLDNYIFMERSKGVAVLKKNDALTWGATGPVLRGSGVVWDLRKVRPYSVYDRFDFDVPVGETGDSWDRIWVRFEESRQSLGIIQQALDMMPEGEVQARGVPRLLKPALGEGYNAIEGHKGELGFYLVSDGSPMPARLKIRSPAFSNLGLLPLLCPGNYVADLVVILSSLDPVFGEVDR